MNKNVHMGLIATITAALSWSPLDALAGATGYHNLNKRIETYIFDAPLREACLKLVSVASSPTAVDFDALQQEARNVYLHARRYRNTYGERRWQTAGTVVAEVFSIIEMSQSPESAKSAINRYRQSLLDTTDLGR